MDAADEPQPGARWHKVVRSIGIRQVFRLQWYPKSWRSAFQRLAIKTRRRDPHDGEREPFNRECRTHDRGVSAIVLLPGLIAHDGNGHRALHIVCKCEHPSRKRINPQRLKVVAADVLPQQRSRLRGVVAIADTEDVWLCLEGGYLVELGRRPAKTLIEVIGENPPFSLRSGRIAASLPRADAKQALRFRHRQ